MAVRTLTRDDERNLKRWLIKHRDIEFAVHSQLRDYFLASTDAFGTAVVEDGSEWTAGIFFSRYKGKGFIHHFLGDVAQIPALTAWLGLPVQAFFVDGVVPDPEVWRTVIHVAPGYVIDHAAYDGVFSRTAPRFHGTVYETMDFK